MIFALLWPLMLLTAHAAPPGGAAPMLVLPVDCRVGATCLVQKLVDHDPGPGRRDYRCGTLTTDGHDGIDIRLRTMADMRAGVRVLAASDGRVARIRDGEADISIRDGGGSSDRQAGNAVVLDHGNGWETQYSHLGRGSILVRPGQRVAAGAPIGRVGLSGNTEYPHLHFTVRHQGKAMDPFLGMIGQSRACPTGSGDQPLWTPAAARALRYQPSAVITAGLASVPPPKAVTDRDPAPGPAGPNAPLLLWVDAIGARPGDRQRFTIAGPDGRTLHDQETVIGKGGLSWFAFSGRRPPSGGWPPGRYRGRYTLIRGQAVVAQGEAQGAL